MSDQDRVECPRCGWLVKPLRQGALPAHNVRRVGRAGGSPQSVYGPYDTGVPCHREVSGEPGA